MSVSETMRFDWPSVENGIRTITLRRSMSDARRQAIIKDLKMLVREKAIAPAFAAHIITTLEASL